jgi:hypothetical protein
MSQTDPAQYIVQIRMQGGLLSQGLLDSETDTQELWEFLDIEDTTALTFYHLGT